MNQAFANGLQPDIADPRGVRPRSAIVDRRQGPGADASRRHSSTPWPDLEARPHHNLAAAPLPTRPNGDIEATFTNGILSTQNLLLQLRLSAAARRARQGVHATAKVDLDSTKGLCAELELQIREPTSAIRSFLTADVLSFLHRFLDKAEKDDAEVFFAL